jgi:hypothetical protein
MMMPEPSWIVIGASAFVVLGLYVVVKSFALPRSFFKKQEKKEELRERFLPEKTPPPA